MKSAYRDYHAFVIKPVNGGIVTQRDQLELRRLVAWRNARFTSYHFATAKRDEALAYIRAAKLSKPMRVTEITDKQWGMRGVLPETIDGTGIHATNKQLAESFIIGG